MRVFWLNGALCLEPNGHVEAEAMLLLLRHVQYELPEGYDEDEWQLNQKGYYCSVREVMQPPSRGVSSIRNWINWLRAMARDAEKAQAEDAGATPPEQGATESA